MGSPKNYIAGSGQPLITTKYIKGTSNFNALVFNNPALTPISDVDGNVTFLDGANPIYYTDLKLYVSNEEVNINDYTISYTRSDPSVTYTAAANGNYKKISLTGLPTDSDYSYIKASITIDGKALVAVLNIAKLKQGETGNAGEAIEYATTEQEGSSITLALGSKTIVVETGLGYTTGQSVIITNIGAETTRYMIGTITSYTSGTGALVVNVTEFEGTGSYTGWGINITGQTGVQGDEGDTGPGYDTGTLNGGAAISIATGTLTVTSTNINMGWTAGQYILLKPVAYLGYSTVYMYGIISSYTVTSPTLSTLVINVVSTSGSGSYTNWSGNLSGLIGPQGLQGIAGPASEVWEELTLTTDFVSAITTDNKIDIDVTSAFVDKIKKGTAIKYLKSGSSTYYYGIVTSVPTGEYSTYTLTISGPFLEGGSDSVREVHITNHPVLELVNMNVYGNVADILGATSGNIIAGTNYDVLSGVQYIDDKYTWLGGKSYLVGAYCGLYAIDSTYDTTFNIYNYTESTNVLSGSSLDTTLDDELTTLSDWGASMDATAYIINHGDQLTIPVDINNIASTAKGFNLTLIFLKDIF